MPRRQSATKLWFQYLAARLAVMGLTTFDIRTNLRTAAALGQAAYRASPRLKIAGRYRQRAQSNLRLAFPQLAQSQIDRLTMRSFEYLTQLAVEICQTPRLIHTDSWPHRIRFKNLGETVELLNRGNPALLLTGHLGSWEVMGFMMTLLGYRIDAIARPFDNHLLYNWLLGIRQRHGMGVITKWNATQRMVGVLESGGALAFIADQNAGDKGLFVPFFGRLASAYKSIGLLALKQRVPVICGYTRRLPQGFRYEVGIEDVIYPDDWINQPDPLYYITARYTRAIENMVRLFPDQYLWGHRRWKSRPPHEKKAKPMPDALRKKLEDLPWMDQPTLDQLAQPIPNAGS